jgi:hypothetical protein
MAPRLTTRDFAELLEPLLRLVGLIESSPATCPGAAKDKANMLRAAIAEIRYAEAAQERREAFDWNVRLMRSAYDAVRELAGSLGQSPGWRSILSDIRDRDLVEAEHLFARVDPR